MILFKELNNITFLIVIFSISISLVTRNNENAFEFIADFRNNQLIIKKGRNNDIITGDYNNYSPADIFTGNFF